MDTQMLVLGDVRAALKVAEAAFNVAEAQAVVAERLGWHLAIAYGVLSGLVLQWRGWLSPPWAWIVAIVVGIIAYLWTVGPYHKAHDAARERYVEASHGANRAAP